MVRIIIGFSEDGICMRRLVVPRGIRSLGTDKERRGGLQSRKCRKILRRDNVPTIDCEIEINESVLLRPDRFYGQRTFFLRLL